MLRYLGSVVLAMLLLPSWAWGHAHLEESDPADGAELDSAPAALLLEFSEGVELRFSSFELVGDGGEALEVTAEAGDDSAMQVELEPEEEIAAGDWRLVWEVLAEDGHTTSGEVHFTVSE